MNRPLVHKLIADSMFGPEEYVPGHGGLGDYSPDRADESDLADFVLTALADAGLRIVTDYETGFIPVNVSLDAWERWKAGRQ